MDTTIRNLDRDSYHAIKAHAAMAGMTIGQAVSEAINQYLATAWAPRKGKSLKEAKPVDFGPGTEHLTQEIDRIVYGP